VTACLSSGLPFEVDFPLINTKVGKGPEAAIVAKVAAHGCCSTARNLLSRRNLFVGPFLKRRWFGRSLDGHNVPLLEIRIVRGAASGYARPEQNLMFGLTIPQIAATLAVSLVAYSPKNAAGQRLVDQPMLNATVVLVIVSFLIGLILTERAAEQVK
jgi:hypothetical protein